MPKFFQIGSRFNISNVFGDMFTKTIVVHAMQDLNTFEDGDVIAFEGGEDISPDLYGEATHQYCGRADKVRDEFEKHIFNTYNGRSKFLGICRGSQFLCAMSGGKLVQNIDNHGSNHIMEYVIDFRSRSATCLVTSTHHQMMYPFNLKDSAYVVHGWSIKRLSTRYDGYVNGNYVDNVPLEPEVVYFTNTKALAIQYHPEFMDSKAPAVEVARALVSEVLLKEGESVPQIKKINIPPPPRRVRLDPFVMGAARADRVMAGALGLANVNHVVIDMEIDNAEQR